MARQNITTLKSYFQTGDTPTEAQFIDVFDTIFYCIDGAFDNPLHVDKNVSGGSGVGVYVGYGGEYQSTAVGEAALAANSGHVNTAFGYYVLNANSTGIENTAGGIYSMLSNDGNYNSCWGGKTMRLATSSSYNCAFGYRALEKGGGASVAMGVGAAALFEGGFGVALGHNAHGGATAGNQQVWIGYEAGYTSEGDKNIGIGGDVGLDLTSGAQNVFVGYNTGRGITTGSYNTILGAAVTGLSSSLANNIILADGQGNIRLQFNSTGTPKLTGIPTGNSGLSTGQLYIDTAANILSNSDLIVAYKV